MKIYITVTELITYSDFVEMSDAEFESFDSKPFFTTEDKEYLAAKIKATEKNWIDCELQDVQINRADF